jgi:general secretion pathway protein B
MSFILDALKKSENDRQRQSGPALFEVRVAPPRSRFPPWAIALVALMVVNLAVIGWLMFRKPAATAAAATPAVSPVTGVPVTPPATTPAPAGPPAQLATAPVTAPPAPAAAYVPPPAPQQQQPQQYGQQNPTLDSQQANNGPPERQQQPRQAYVPDDRFNNASQSQAEGNPDDYAPATEPTGEAPLGHVRRGLSNGLMTYEEAATKNQIPPLRLDLHVYAPDPRRRFVLVNMKKLTEGESLPEGVKLESITTDGAILSYRGVQFMMERD